MNKCPKCGGANGYVTDESQIFRRFTSWDGEETDCEFVSTGYKHRKPRCADCGEPIRIPADHKGNIV